VGFAATLPLVNAILFRYVSDAKLQGYVFIWAPVAWALIGYFLTGLRQLKGTGDGRDCLYLGAILSVVMAAICLLQPAAPPQAQQTQPIVAALGMLQEPNYLLFILVSLGVAGMMQFYFLGTAPFMQDMGISSENVPGSMAMAQAVQALATFFLLGVMLNYAGPKWTLAVGSACWFVLYVFYVVGRPPWMIVTAQGLHGLAYVFFMIAGQIYVGMVAPRAIMASAQSLIFLATVGVGLFIGTQAAGYVMEKNNVGGKFQWKKIWIVPLAVTLAGALILGAFFQDPPKPAPTQKPAEKASAAVSVEPTV
jgi:MFS family permease